MCDYIYFAKLSYKIFSFRSTDYKWGTLFSDQGGMNITNNNSCKILNLVSRTKLVNSNELLNHAWFWMHVICFLYGEIINIAMIVGIMKTNKLLKTSQKLFILLCTIDLSIIITLAANYTLVLFDTVQNLEPKECSFLNRLWFAIYGFNIMFELMVLLVIVLDRYVALQIPFYFERPKMIILLLTLSAFLTVTYSTCLYFFETNLINLISICLFLILNILMVAINSKLLFSLKKNKLSQNSHNSASTESHIRGVRTLLYITLTALVCLAPLIVVSLIFLYSGSLSNTIKEKLSHSGEYIFVFYLLNSGLNSHIYIYRSKNMCQFYKNGFGWKQSVCIS